MPEYTEVLDHGFVGLIDHMGDDSSVVNAARVSYGSGTKAVSSDEGLIRYLLRHQHTTPFEMVSFKFHLKMPIFVARQFIRHRTAKINEISGRYSVLDNEMYIPSPDVVSTQAKNNKQGRNSTPLNEDDYRAVCDALDDLYNSSYETYEYLCGPQEGHVAAVPSHLYARRLEVEKAAMEAIQASRNAQMHKPIEEQVSFTKERIELIISEWLTNAGVHVPSSEYKGIARELARIVLPLSTYTQFYWKNDMHNLFHFLKLRMDSHAQYEIRVYADAMYNLIKDTVPYSIKAFDDYIRNAKLFSRMEKDIVRMAMNSEIDITNHDDVASKMETMGASKREIREFLDL